MSQQAEDCAPALQQTVPLDKQGHFAVTLHKFVTVSLPADVALHYGKLFPGCRRWESAVMLTCWSVFSPQAVQGRQSVESALQAQKRQQAAATAAANEQAKQLRHAVADLEQAQAALANAQQELSHSQERLSGADALSGRIRQLQEQLREKDQQAADTAQLLGVKDAQLAQLHNDLQAGEPKTAPVEVEQQAVMIMSAHGSAGIITDALNTTRTSVHDNHA